MKYKILILLILTITFNACNSVDDLNPTFRLDLDKAIIDEASANTVLSGLYSKLRDAGFVTGVNTIHSAMGLTYQDDFGTVSDLASNEPRTSGAAVTDFYLGCYSIIQEANVFLQNIAIVDAAKFGGEDVKNNLIGEARFLRALGHFYLLKGFGKFYDATSNLGVVVRLEPAKELVARSTVTQTYEAINNDLDFAINNLTNFETYKANAVAAKGLKAKVKLYEKEYAMAATLASEAIAEAEGNGKTFPEVFAHTFSYLGDNGNVVSAHESSSLLFGPYTNTTNERGNLSLVTNSTYFDSAYDVLAGFNGLFDPRYPLIAEAQKGFDFIGVNFDIENAPTLMFLRLEELYLIHAEAELRKQGGSFNVAKNSLNKIRTRTAVDLASDTSTTPTELLEAIRIEKLLELATETGEEFFDIVRYHSEGNLIASNIKNTMTNENFFILPIPDTELLNPGASDIIKQNPGY